MQGKTTLKPTVAVLGVVVCIVLVAVVLGGVRVYQNWAAPRIEVSAASLEPVQPATPAPATPAPTRTPTATPAPDWQRVQEGSMTYYAPPPADAAELRAAFAAIMGHTQVVTASAETLLAFDREASRARVAPLLAEGYEEWNQLDTKYVFVSRAFGPENPIRCTEFTHCEMSRAQLYTEAVIIFNADVCTQGRYAHTPCLVPLVSDEQINGRYRLMVVQFVKETDGVWRMYEWTNQRLPDPPASP